MFRVSNGLQKTFVIPGRHLRQHMLINYYYNKHIIGDWDFETHIKQTLEREGFMIQFQLGKQINLHINWYNKISTKTLAM